MWFCEKISVSVYSLACKRVLTCTTVVMETIPPFYYMRACPILDLYLVVTRKRALSEFNLVKNCFDESDEIKFLTKISCYTVFNKITLPNSLV